MRKILIVSSVWLGAVACSSMGASSTEPAAIDVRHSGSHVSGTSLQCTGNWPGSATPCTYPQVAAIDETAGVVDLRLGLGPAPIDVDSTWVELSFETDGTVFAVATESPPHPGNISVVLHATGALGGWVDPDAAGSTSKERSSGSLTLTFPWGTVSGTYDTATTL